MKARRMAGLRITNKPCMLAIIVLLVLPCGLTQQTDEHYIVEPTPALRLGEDDLTTVLLVNNDNRTEAHGRFLNVRPTVGVLTSTARTFIQEGVTTEYATQVLGTTLENGRLYAQLLKKSSRVLYDKENVITPSAIAGGVVHTSIVGEGPHYHLFAQPKSLLQSHNDLVGDKDWQDVDDRIILEKNSFVGNTDYVGSVPRASQIVYPVKSASASEAGNKEEVVALNKSFSSSRSTISSEAFRIKANKVQPAVDLPTFTVKNMFSPSGFSWESSPLEKEREETFETHSQVTVSEQRSPKLLYHQVLKDEHRQLSTVTYYGFADFTTIVGDSVIVFSPSTSSDQVPLGHVTSIKGEATLGPQEASYVSNVAITITQDLIEPTFVVPMLSTDVSDLQVKPKDMRVKNEEELIRFGPPVQIEAEIEVTTVPQEEPKPVEVVSYEIQTSVEIPKEDTEEHTTLAPTIEEDIATTVPPPTEEEEEQQHSTGIEHEEEIILASSMSDVDSAATTSLTPEPSPVETTSRVMLSRPSDEEILRIYSSLASAEAAKKASDVSEASLASIAIETTTQGATEPTTEKAEIPEETLSTAPNTTTTEESIQPDVKIQGGATTIFFEDDPFLDFVSPSSTETVATATQVYTQTSANTELEQVSSTSEAPEEEKTNPPMELETESVTEDVLVTEVTEPNIEATTTIVDTDTEQDDAEKKPDAAVSEVVFKPIIKEIDENEQVEGCSRTSQVFLTQVPKTLTYYTTFFIPNEQNEDETSTSIETNIVPSFDIAQATKHYCIQPTQVVSVLQTTDVPVLERPSKPEESNVIDSNIEELPEATTPMMIVRENAEVTESSDIDASGAGYEDEDEEDEEEDEEESDSGEEIELIYKTLYTTYTYLTTFFHDATTSVSSRKEVVTNIITSSLGMDNIRSSDVADIQATATASNEVTPTLTVGIGRPTAKFVVQSSDLDKVESEADSLVKPTAQLDDSKLAKTYYTTYTYYTTIFVDGETEVMSRTEVHTNILGKATDASGSSHLARNLNIDDTVFDEDNAVIDIRPTATYDTIQRTAIASEVVKQVPKQIEGQLKYTTLNRVGIQELESSASSSSSRTEKKIVPIEDDPVKMVTDVRSSSSNGDHHLIENGVLEDQISSESNTDEILPSATLLLQTSFTTFTYYTTMYSSEVTNVVSRLETVTNVVTETLQPTKTLSVEEATLPITYFTTFTYWTKLAKDGEITTLSREETVSNVVTPTLSSESSVTPTVTSEQPVYLAEPAAVESVSPSAQVDATALSGLEPTTYYTTYTYYTTSYAGDQTITDSRFETVTNVVTPTSVASPIPVSVVTEEVSKIEQPVLEAVPAEVKRVEPPKTLSYDYKTIVDAEGISTLYFKTELVATTINGVSTEIASSTSTINIDEVKKALSTTSIPEGSESTRTYKTGLVRLIEGTKLTNHTTTIYQSKVIGTIIDQRYAQIIESTSSFIIEKTQAPVLDAVAQISATSTLSPTSVQPTAFIAASSSKAIESSIGDAAEEEIEQTHDEEEDENDSEEEDDESGRPRTRLSFQTKKKTFTPVIRPFASRNRPQFAPKRKNLLPSSATIITRSDFTPTITATPAIKSDSRGRFSSSRKVNSGLSSTGISGSSSQGGKRFGRPSKSSQFGGFGSSSRFPGSSRNSLQSSRVQGSSSNFGGFASSRRSGTPFRGGSSTNIRSFSSAYAGNSRQRIRPSSSLPYENAPNTAGYTTLSPDSGEEDSITQRYDSEEETDVTTENLRRNNNPLLRFRRPQVSRPPFQPGQRNAASNQVSGRRNPLTPKPKTTTSTTTTTTTNRPRPRAFQRPPVGGIQNRARPQSNLFPPRRLFQPQNQAIDEEQKTSDDFQDNEDDESDSGEYESDDEGDDDEQDATNRRRRDSFTKRLQIKKRSKRQANNFRNRFRRPLTTKPTTEDRVEEEETPSTVRSRASSRFAPRTHNLPTTTHANSRAPPQSNGRAIRPTKPNSSSRAQFTLRESNTTPKLPSRPSTNFRRPVPNGGGRRTTTTASRPKAPRLKSYGSTVTESSHHTSPRGGKTPSSRSRSTARGRSRNDFVTDPAIPVFDGTITVTHTSPTEITIPVVNGKVTEYKNVVTSTTSIEVILPNQYTSIIGQNGASTLILNREETSVNANGANEVTQFILHESPTTSVVFTPTTIRGRKTSFAHVIPSTAYQVENVVSTMQAQLAANAPLANILLSQLLLGNIGLNQANLNPLLGLGATQAVSQVPGEPMTEYKTRTSTYVTTVTNEPDLNTNRQQLQQQNTHNLNAMFDSQHETPSITFSPISKPEPTESGRFFHFGSFDIGPPISSDSTYPDDDDNDDSISGATGVAEEARYNLATRVMSNGVEVIIAGDKNGKGKPNALRILPSLSRKPMTLAPSTLKDQMILVMPSNAQENYTIPINSNHFITKTCLTTYTYRTTYLQDGKTTVESREKVVSNTATEERNYLKISPTESLGVTLSRTPELAVGVFHTTYTYYNTIMDGDLPLVVSSQHVLTNTITGPDDYISFLQPSEEATPVLETNTYFSEISLTKTLKESDIEKIVSTSNILTQVIITESLPPRSTAVMTSYIAFDIDETSTQERPDISATDTQFHTYTYYNAEKNDSVQHTDDSQGNPNEKSYLYLKKDATPSLEKTSHSALTATSKLQGSLQSDMHIYATKTYLTTFTYFTTLMNTLGNVASSTVVNFHTRVIENVITESIPSFMIDTDLLSKFETNLKNPKNHNSYITMVTLAGGQSLEITAMNMIHHPSPTIAKTQTTSDNTENDVAVKLEPTAVVSSAPAASITPPPADNSNEVLDSEVASSENEEQYIESETNFPKNNTKTAAATTDFPSVNQIIGSLNLNRLQALGPVFNAMAGLIQNNFGTNLSNDMKKNTSNVNVESKHSAKNISAYDTSAQVHDGPIYIPVQNLHGNPDDINVAGYISPQSLHISPPDTDWFMDEKKNRGKPELSSGKPTYETPLLNGGIPISPGEVITANSDVIVGKPNGIQPRVPFNSKTSDASNALLPPPPFSYQFQYQQHPKQTKANPSPIPLEASYDKQMNFDGILKPPPLKPPSLQHQQQLQQHQQQQLQQQQIQQQQHQQQQQLQQHQHQQQQQNTKKLVPLNPNYNPNYRVHYATGHMHQPQHIPMQGHHQQQQQQHHLQRPNVQRPGHYSSAFQVNTNPRPISQKPNYIPYAPHDYDQPHPPNDKKNQLDLNQDLHNNEILEIKQIPQVYSTDLPGTEAGITSTSNSLGSGNYKTLIKKVINSDKPMLVDIKPSQITNIVIPRDNSASILIVESAVELHKNGQYYDEPTSYPDALVTGNVVAQVQPARKPILSNQQVNLDMNVLSHNVDINVPPLTFKKDSDFPHSTPVRGQIQKHEQTNFQMPHVTIPLSDNQIQVHLTPQNMITQQKVPGQFFNDIDSPHGSANDAADTLQALEPTRYTNPHSNTIQGKPQIYLHPAQDHKRRPYNNNRPQDHSYQYGKIHRPMSTLKGTGSTSAFPVPQFIDLPSKNKPPMQVIPLGSAAPKNPYKQRPHQEEYLQIFANVTPAQRPLKIDGPVQARPNFNPTPLLNLFYGSPNDGEEDLSGDFSQAPPPSKQGENYWQADSIQQDDEDEDATEESDQKAASSLNVGIPTQSQPTENDSAQSQSQKPKPTYHSRTTPKPPSKAITQLDIKSPGFGTESYLDPASVSAVNNMGELDVQPSPPPNTPPTMMRPPSPGRPFTQNKPNVRPPQRVKNDQTIFINSGEGFKLQYDKEQNQSGFVQVSLPVDTKETEILQKDSSTQTEAPFNPKYTKRTKRPQKSPPQITTTTTTSPASTPARSPPSLNLNKLEVVGLSGGNQSNSAEIFDFHESMNPHNYDFVHIATEESTTLKETAYTSDPMTQRPGLTNLYPFVSEPAVNLKPPPVSTLPQTENVMGLNPPPPPTVPVSISTPHFTPSMSPPVTTYKTINVTATNRNPLLPASHTTLRPMKVPTHSTKAPPPSKYSPSSTSRPRTRPAYSSINRPTASTVLKRRPPPPTAKTSSSSPQQTAQPKTSTTYAPSSSTPTILENKTDSELDILPTLSTEMQEEPPNAGNSRRPAHNDGKNGGTYEMPMFTLSQKIPDEILIEGSEEDHRRRSTIKIFENQTETTTMIRKHPILTDNHLQQSMSKPQQPLNHINTRTRITSRIIIPTKYVTNTHVLTVTTTKISVLTSLGIPSTQTFTLTKTKTSTLVDTVTETHTLLQPTRVTESHTTTATQIIHTDYHHPLASIQPTIEVVNPVPTNNESTEPPTRLPITTPSSTPNLDSNSIFVVMTDKKSHGGVFSISPSIIDTPQNINAIGGTTGGGTENENSIELDYDDNIGFDLPARDEEAETNEVNHVLLGGVLIATPPKSSDSNHLGVPSTSCRPSCKASRNELCQQVDSRMLCVCRPGFARMFPDRPCRPTYTYAMQIPIYRISKQVLHFKDQYRVRDSEDFKQLAGITHDAVDRMVMQSDLRDVYHGVHVTSFDATNSENGILGKFLIQLSDNSDEKRLVDVFKKYLRQNNFSLGGTEIFTTKNGVNSLEIVDFNECAHSQFHDCSENSRCFNLQGTYTCSCQEGFADLSENSIYPGRICSAEVIGCEKCHYHGKCVQMDKAISPVCECFHWYTGASCQLNLKILLIALIAVGTILFILLLFCVLVTCTRRRKNHNMQSLMSGIHIIAPRNSRLSSKSLTTDKRAMIKDSSSEASQNSLPYVLKKDSKKLSMTRNKTPQQQQAPYRNINQRGHPSSTLVSSLSEVDHRHNYSEQNDRSLTVMIPRAKYHHSVVTQSAIQGDSLDHATHNNEPQQLPKISTTESASKASTFHCSTEKIPSPPSKTSSSNHGALHTTSTGALVSAGFEVSATVGNIVCQQMPISNSNTNLSSTYETTRGNQMPKLVGELHSRKSNYQDPHLQYNTYKDGEKFIDSMDVWLDTIQQNELTAEARSFDETTIQAPTKSLRSVYERQMSQSNGNDEANTMAERDIGSTFLLPHTHLYKPDRDSDVSGFDSF